jgi:hemoglobin-like flavoprotein
MEMHASIQRILEAKDELGTMFYERLFAAHPEFQQYFERVDFQRQNSLLVTGLMIIEAHATRPTPATETYLQYLGTRHHDMKVPKHLYDAWVETMLQTMHEFHGQEWSSDLEQQWRRAFRVAVDTMFEGYNQRVTV